MSTHRQKLHQRFEDETVSHMCSLYQLARVETHHNYTADPGNTMLGLSFFGVVLSSSTPYPPTFLLNFLG